MSQNRIISPSRDKHKKHLKPPPTVDILTMDGGATSNPYKPEFQFFRVFPWARSSKLDAPLMHGQRLLKHVRQKNDQAKPPSFVTSKHIQSDKFIVSFNQKLNNEKKHTESSMTRNILASS